MGRVSVCLRLVVLCSPSVSYLPHFVAKASWSDAVLPSCLFGAYDVCSVLCVIAFCFSSFTFSSDFRERGVVFFWGKWFQGLVLFVRMWVLLSGRTVFVVSPLQLFLCRNGMSPRCWRLHLGDRIQLLHPFICVTFSTFSKRCVPLAPSSRLGPSLILFNFVFCTWPKKGLELKGLTCLLTYFHGSKKKFSHLAKNWHQI